MRIGLLLLYLFSPLGAVRCCTGFNRPPGAGCCIHRYESNSDELHCGRTFEGRRSHSFAVLSDATSGSEQQCGWLTLHNLATVMGLSGRLAEAEVLEAFPQGSREGLSA